MISPSPIKEDLLHYVWKTKSFDQNDLKTTDGLPISILKFGFPNAVSGPDFSNGMIKIGDLSWSGNIEMHVFSSQWFQHGHQHDDAYRNVILHVVFEHDKQIYRQNGKAIPTLELKDRIFPNVRNKYIELIQNENWIPCASVFPLWSEDKWSIYLTALMVERLEKKTIEIDHIHNYCRGDWEQVSFILLAKYLGSNVNGLPMEWLAKSIDCKLFYKNKGNLLFSDAILFGQAGMLASDFQEDYPLALKKEYKYLANKYNLSPIDVSVWKFGRIRPPNFPSIRIAQLSGIMANAGSLFHKIISAVGNHEIADLLRSETHNYWNNHYRFGKTSRFIAKHISEDQLNLILINLIAPLVFSYGKKVGDEKYQDRAIQILEEIKSEKNSIIKQWKLLGPAAKNAAESQALIQLKKTYCDHMRCLECRIGHHILQEK